MLASIYVGAVTLPPKPTGARFNRRGPVFSFLNHRIKAHATGPRLTLKEIPLHELPYAGRVGIQEHHPSIPATIQASYSRSSGWKGYGSSIRGMSRFRLMEWKAESKTVKLRQRGKIHDPYCISGAAKQSWDGW